MAGFVMHSEAPHVVIDGHIYATGLVWETIAADDEKIIDYVKSRAEAHNADLFCINDHETQCGFGSTEHGQKAKMPSLAITIQENVNVNMIGMFALHEDDDMEETYYFIAVVDGCIEPSTDVVYHDRATAEAAMSDLFYSSIEWKRIVAPENMNQENAEDEPITDYLKISGKIRLRSITESNFKRNLLVTVGVIALIGGGYFVYNHHIAQIEQKRIMEEMKKKQKDRDKEENEKRMLHIPAWPWENKEKGMDAIKECQVAILNAPIDFAGWSATKVGCDGHSVSISLTRGVGTINWLSHDLTNLGFHYSMKMDAKSNAIVSWELPTQNVPKYQRNDIPGNLDKEKLYLTQQFDEDFQKVSLQQSNGQPIEATVDVRGGKERIYLYKQMDIIFDTQINPDSYLDILHNLSMFTLESMTLDISKWTWNIKVRSYEKVPIPPGVMVAPDTPQLPSGAPIGPRKLLKK